MSAFLTKPALAYIVRATQYCSSSPCSVQWYRGGSIDSVWNTAISESASAWNGKAQFSFTEATSSDTTLFIDLAFLEGSDAPGVTLNTMHPLDSTVITHSKTYLNAYYTWNTSGTMDKANKKTDVKTVAMHEFGHWLVLDHDSRYTSAVMWPNWTKKWSLTTDDINGIKAIYP